MDSKNPGRSKIRTGFRKGISLTRRRQGPAEMAKKEMKPTADEIFDGVVRAIIDRKISLPSFKQKVGGRFIGDLAAETFAHGGGWPDELHKVGMAVEGEISVLTHNVMGIIHGMDARDAYAPNDAEHFTPAIWLRNDKQRLIQLYADASLVEGKATVEQNFMALRNRAVEFVEAVYPEYGSKGRPRVN
jgi:hypothetical protein